MINEDVVDYETQSQANTDKPGKNLKLYICNCSHHRHGKNITGVAIHPNDWKKLVENYSKIYHKNSTAQVSSENRSNIAFSSRTKSSSVSEYNYDDDPYFDGKHKKKNRKGTDTGPYRGQNGQGPKFRAPLSWTNTEWRRESDAQRRRIPHPGRRPHRRTLRSIYQRQLHKLRETSSSFHTSCPSCVYRFEGPPYLILWRACSCGRQRYELHRTAMLQCPQAMDPAAL